MLRRWRRRVATSGQPELSRRIFWGDFLGDFTRKMGGFRIKIWIDGGLGWNCWDEIWDFSQNKTIWRWIKWIGYNSIQLEMNQTTMGIVMRHLFSTTDIVGGCWWRALSNRREYDSNQPTYYDRVRDGLPTISAVFFPPTLLFRLKMGYPYKHCLKFKALFPQQMAIGVSSTHTHTQTHTHTHTDTPII